MKCPCCGTALKHIKDPMDLADYLPLSEYAFRIMLVYAKNFGKAVKTTEVLREIYWGQAEPENAEPILAVQLTRLNKRLREYNLIINSSAAGAGSPGRRMHWIAPPGEE